MEGCHESRATGQGILASTEIGVECHRGRTRARRVSNSELCAIVAAIPAICAFIGTAFFGVSGYRIGIGASLASAIVLYVLSMIGVFVVAYIIDFLAGTFGARKRADNAMRVPLTHRPPPGWPACSTSFRRCRS